MHSLRTTSSVATPDSMTSCLECECAIKLLSLSLRELALLRWLLLWSFRPPCAWARETENDPTELSPGRGLFLEFGYLTTEIAAGWFNLSFSPYTDLSHSDRMSSSRTSSLLMSTNWGYSCTRESGLFRLLFDCFSFNNSMFSMLSRLCSAIWSWIDSSLLTSLLSQSLRR